MLSAKSFGLITKELDFDSPLLCYHDFWHTNRFDQSEYEAASAIRAAVNFQPWVITAARFILSNPPQGHNYLSLIGKSEPAAATTENDVVAGLSRIVLPAAVPHVTAHWRRGDVRISSADSLSRG